MLIRPLACVCFGSPEELLEVEGMVDLKKAESISAIHLINAARLGNRKAEAVLRTGGSTLLMLVEHHLKSDLLLHKLK